jgi:CRISPR-associated protein Cmr6
MISNPLQALNLARFDDTPIPALKEAVNAEHNCQSYYKRLTQRTKNLANEWIKIQFAWRLRVGGVRGFYEILLPALHPVYGIPYIPSASIKGAVKAWAKKRPYSREYINQLLGDESEKSKGIGCVQFLDAFPTEPCLTVDVVNPQWRWQDRQVNYKSDPHFFLSMEEPEIIFGLTRTSRGNLNDVRIVKGWLEQALATGIGSRVSAGYGRTNRVAASFSYSYSRQFQLWTQGIYGASPPSRDNEWIGEAEFRPTALRGILRYWFRVVALGLYSPSSCKDLEANLFGTIEPKAKEGNIRIGIDWEEQKTYNNEPYWYKGTILLEAKEEKYLTLVQKILKLASHLGGIGRGSRRPLHWNRPRFRGCHWELDDYILPCDSEVWQKFMKGVVDAFKAVQSIETPDNGSPGNPGNRKQDVLNNNASIYLVSCDTLIHPEEVTNWEIEGETINVRGKALSLLYSSDRFKGQKKDRTGRVVGGNNYVGGALETPSYVLIKSNFPYNADPYQVVTIFGSNYHNDRAAFCQEIEKIGGIKINWE